MDGEPPSTQRFCNVHDDEPELFRDQCLQSYALRQLEQLRQTPCSPTDSMPPIVCRPPELDIGTNVALC